MTPELPTHFSTFFGWAIFPLTLGAKESDESSASIGHHWVIFSYNCGIISNQHQLCHYLLDGIGSWYQSSHCLNIVLGLSCILNIPGLIICNSVQYGTRGQCRVVRKVGINYRCHRHCSRVELRTEYPRLNYL